MAGLKLSDLDPSDIEATDAPKSAGLKLSDLHPDDVEAVKVPAPSEDEGPSKLESFTRGGVQGATLGYSDEMLGGLKAGSMKAADIAHIGEPTKKSLKDLYKEYRDTERKKNKAAEEANPKTYLGGNIAGGIASSIVAPEALAAKSIGGAAALGAATGLGTSETDLTDPNVENLEAAAKDVAIGGTVGAGAGLLAKGAQKLLTPKTLETAGSKMASSAVGLKPTQELAKEFSEETGKVMQGSDIIKGIGKTAVEEGALPTTGGASNIYDKSIQAIDANYDKLNPLVSDIQNKLPKKIVDLKELVNNIGGIDGKVTEFADQFANKIPETSGKEALTNKLFKTFSYYKDKLAQNEGNLDGLLKVKRELQDAATSLTKNVYNDANASEKLTEAQFLKQLGGIVRQHTEDLAGAVDPQAAEQLGSINKTLSNLYTYRDAARKMMDKPASSTGLKDVAVAAGSAALGHPILGPTAVVAKAATEAATGQTLGTTGKILGAKAMLGAAKKLDTPAGELVQKVVPAAVKRTVLSPFAEETAQGQSYSDGGEVQPEQASNDTPIKAQATQLSSNLYNATDDSLRQVADHFSSSDALSGYGKQLHKALNDKDENLKNRVVFAIMQNPATRKLVTPQDAE